MRLSATAAGSPPFAVAFSTTPVTFGRAARYAVGSQSSRNVCGDEDEMTVHYTLTSHGTVLGHTGAAFPADELPPGAYLWHLVPTRAFDLIEPIIAELTAPPALTLVEEVIPTRDDYLHPGWSEQEAQMDRLMDEAARVHHFRLVLERYESLQLELHDATGRRVAVSPMIVKQIVPTETVRAFAEAVDPEEAQWIDEGEPCYLVMAHLEDSAAAGAAVAAATAA